MRGTNSFFRRVLGIVPSSKAKEENIRARNAKEKPRFVPWDYATDSTGKPMGTLYAINIHTDLFVYARGIKRGRSYEEVEFYFTSPDFFQKGKWKEELMYAPDLFAPTSSPSLPQIPDGTIEKKRLGLGHTNRGTSTGTFANLRNIECRATCSEMQVTTNR